MLALSHDEVVHLKRSLLEKMPGDEWQKFANLRLLLGLMFTMPGKKLLFMGGEIGEYKEWNQDISLDWSLLWHSKHRGLQHWVRDLNALYRGEPALHQLDFESRGFEWIDCSDRDQSVVSFIRRGNNPDECLLVVFNFTPVPRKNYRVGVPWPGYWQEVLNSDSTYFGGSNMGNAGGVTAEGVPIHNQPNSLSLTLPPLGMLVLKGQRFGASSPLLAEPLILASILNTASSYFAFLTLSLTGLGLSGLGLYLASKSKVPFLKSAIVTTFGLGFIVFKLSAGDILLSAIAALSQLLLVALIRLYVSGNLGYVAYTVYSIFKSLFGDKFLGEGIFYIMPLSPKVAPQATIVERALEGFNITGSFSIVEFNTKIEYRVGLLPFHLITINREITIPCAYLVLYPNLKGELKLSFALENETTLGEKSGAIKKLLDKVIQQIRADFSVPKARECAFNPLWLKYISLYPRMLISYQDLRKEGKDRGSAWREIFTQARNEYPELTQETLEEMLLSVFSLMPEERLLREAEEFVRQAHREEWPYSQIKEPRAALKALACELAADSIDDYAKVMQILREEFGGNLVSLSKDSSKLQRFYERLANAGLGEWVVSSWEGAVSLRLSAIDRLEKIFLGLPEHIPGARRQNKQKSSSISPDPSSAEGGSTKGGSSPVRGNRAEFIGHLKTLRTIKEVSDFLDTLHYLDPDRIVVMVHIASRYLGAGDYLRAEDWANRAIKGIQGLSADDQQGSRYPLVTAYEVLSRAYRGRGHVREASDYGELAV